MKGKISKIKNTKGELALPITTVEAVYMEDGTTKLSDEIKDVLKCEAFDDGNITAEIPSVIEQIDGIKKDISEINETLDNNTRKIEEVAKTGTTMEVVQNKLTEMLNDGSIVFNTVTPSMTTFFENDGLLYNLYDSSKDTLKSYLNSSGNVTVSESETYKYYVTTDFIDLKDNDYFIISNCKPWGIALYDGDTFLVRYTGDSAIYDEPISTSYNGVKADKIRVTFNKETKKGNYNKAMIIHGDETKPYSPYGGSDFLMEEYLKPSSEFDKVFFNKGTKISAWRGFCYKLNENGYYEAYAPQNSMPSFKLACKEGADFLWLATLQFTNDGVCVVCHDNNLSNWVGENVNISDLTYEELSTRKLIDESKNNWSDKDLQIPKFEDIIKLSRKYKIPMGIRLGALASSETTDLGIRNWSIFKNICNKYDLSDCIFSGTGGELRIMNDFKPNWYVQETGKQADTSKETIERIDKLVNIGYKYKSLIVYKNAIDDETMAYARNKNVKIFAVAEEPIIENSTLEFYRDICVDGIIVHHLPNDY